jgi:hypothetical protein
MKALWNPFFANFDKSCTVLREDLGEAGGHRRHSYELDEFTRDILIVHARQDAAHALLNTGSLLIELRLVLMGIVVLLLKTFHVF